MPLNGHAREETGEAGIGVPRTIVSPASPAISGSDRGVEGTAREGHLATAVGLKKAPLALAKLLQLPRHGGRAAGLVSGPWLLFQVDWASFENI